MRLGAIIKLYQQIHIATGHLHQHEGKVFRSLSASEAFPNAQSVFHSLIHKAIRHMVVDHARSLHKRVYDC